MSITVIMITVNVMAITATNTATSIASAIATTDAIDTTIATTATPFSTYILPWRGCFWACGACLSVISCGQKQLHLRHVKYLSHRRPVYLDAIRLTVVTSRSTNC